MRRHLHLLSLLSLLTLALYLPVLSLYFCSDDFIMLGPFSASDLIHCFYTRCGISENASGWFRPTAVILYELDYLFFKYQASGYHFTNLFLYLLTVIAFYLLSFQLTKRKTYAFMGALFFAVAPVHSDAVAWISGRNTLLSALFYTLSLSLFIASRQKEKSSLYFASLFSFLMALCSKEDAVTLPFVLFLYGLTIDRKMKLNLLLPFFLLQLGYFLLKTYVLKTAGGYEMGRPFLELPPLFYIKYYVLVKLQTLILPYVRTIYILPLLFIFFIFPAFLFCRRHSHLLRFLLGFFWLAFLPYFFVESNYRMGVWYMVLPSIPFSILIGVATGKILNAPKISQAFFLMSFLGILGIYAHTTRSRLNDWKRASALVQDIPQQMAHFLPKNQKKVTLYIYGVPHSYRGAYVYANGLENALRMTFSNPSIKAFPNIVLDLPSLESFLLIEKRKNNYVFAYMKGKVYLIKLSTPHRASYTFENVQGETFSVPVKALQESYGKIKRPLRGYLDLPRFNQTIAEMIFELAKTSDPQPHLLK